MLFSKLLVYAELPADDPEFLLAVDAVRENGTYCGTIETSLSEDPACHNHYRAAHNAEGASVFTGDMYAKAQDLEAAREAYEAAMLSADWESWDYQDLLLERLDTLGCTRGRGADGVDLRRPRERLAGQQPVLDLPPGLRSEA